MFIFEYIIVVIFGLYLGSFFTAISLRIANNEKVFVKRSLCDSCYEKIPFLYLNPILGYILSFGKCKNYIFSENLYIFSIFSLLTTSMFVACIIDFETMYIYNLNILLFAVLIFLFFSITKHLSINANSFFCALLPLIFKFTYEFIRKIITKKNIIIIGIGDIYIFIILFFLLDFLKIAMIIGLSGLFGIFFGIIGKNVKIRYPFIPSIFLSFYIILILEFL